MGIEMESGHEISKRAKSFKYAFNGICIMLKSEKNAWIHLFFTIGVIIAGFIFNLTRAEWVWVILAIAGVWTAESLNTALEFLTDVVSPEFHPLVEKSKDVAAGAVLITAIGAAIIGFLVFIPHFI